MHGIFQKIKKLAEIAYPTYITNTEMNMAESDLEIEKGMQIYLERKNYAASLTDWIRINFEYVPAIAATLTFKSQKNGSILTPEIGDACMVELGKRLNRRAFGQRSKAARGGRKVNFVPVREGGGCTGKPLHYHAVIGIPDKFDSPQWAVECAKAWGGLKIASKSYNTFIEVRDNGWYEYMTKLRTKDDPLDYLVIPAVQLESCLEFTD